MSFGKWLLAQRERVGLTQAELATRAGISPNYVSALEREEPNARDGSPRRPRLDKVDRIARALGTDVNETRLAAGYAAQTEPLSFNIADKARIALLDKNLTPEQAAEIIEEMTIAYNVIMERRRLREEKENTRNDKR